MTNKNQYKIFHKKLKIGGFALFLNPRTCCLRFAFQILCCVPVLVLVRVVIESNNGRKKNKKEEDTTTQRKTKHGKNKSSAIDVERSALTVVRLK
jgi:hypothetical protein